MSQEIHTHLEKLKRELDKLAPAIQHLRKADEDTTTLVRVVNDLHQEYGRHLDNISESMKEANQEHQKQIQKLISDKVKKLEDATATFAESSSSLDSATKKLLKGYLQISEGTTKLLEKIDGIDFPTRLDKLDATVSSINQGFQNVQQKIGDVERNIKDDVQAKSKEVTSELARYELYVRERLNKIQDSNKVLRIVALASLGISAAILISMFFK